MGMDSKDLGFDELFGLEDVDSFLREAKVKCEQKLHGKSFAGMERDDVVQEVLIKVHRSIGQFDNTKSKLSTYVDHVIENMIKDCFKRCGSDKNLMLVNALEIDDSFDQDHDEPSWPSAQVGSIDAGYLHVDITTDIAHHLNLTMREHEVFELRTQGYDFMEIASIMDISKARISQIWRGIKEKYDRS